MQFTCFTGTIGNENNIENMLAACDLKNQNH